MSLAVVRAALRLSPRQVAYHLKRKGRNLLAARFPLLYAWYVGRVAGAIPAIDLTGPGRATALELARVVAPYYEDEYREAMDDAAQGRFTFFAQTVDFGSPAEVDWHHTVDAEQDFHLWRMKLGHMGFVCPMLISGNEDHLAAVSELFASFRARADFGTPGCFSSYWFPYSASHRILAVLSGYVLARDSRELPEPLQAEIEEFLRWNAGFVLANIEHELRNNHVERNLAALCLYFACVGSVPGRITRRLDREVRRVIHACVLPDGLIAERSAMYQGLAVMALGVFAQTPFLSEATRELAQTRHDSAVSAWLTMTHPDGEIALFNDSWFGEVPKVGAVTAPGVAGPVGLLADAGYARLEAGNVFVLMDAGPIGPRWNPGHGHADFLAVEADIAGRRFVVDPGTYQYSTGPRRTFERSAQSHNGPVRDGLEPVEYAGCFRVGRMRAAQVLDFEAIPDGGSVKGRLGLPDGSAVERAVTVLPGLIRVTDEWSRGGVGAQVRLTIPDGWQAAGRADGRLSFTQGADRAEIVVLDGTIAAVEAGDWSCEYLQSRVATVVTLLPPASAEKTARLVWEMRALS